MAFIRGNPLWSLLARHGRAHWRQFAAGIAAQIAGRFPNALPGLLIGVAIDSIILGDRPYRLPLVPDAWLPRTTTGMVALTLALLAATYPATTLLSVVSRRRLGRFNQLLQHDVRTGTFDTVQRLEMEYFDENETGRIMSILNDDVRELNAAVYGVLNAVARAVTRLIAMFAFLLWLNWQLATALLVVPAVFGAMAYWISSILEPKHLAVRERVGEINDRLNNDVGGISVIKSCGTEDLERERIREVSGEHKEAKWDVQFTQVSLNQLLMLVDQAGQLFVLAAGGYWILVGPPLVFTGTLTAGALFTFYYYSRQFTESAERLAGVVDPYQEAKAAATRIREVLDADRTTARKGATALDGVDGAVEYDDATFSYSHRDGTVLEDVRFAVEPGTTVGVVGPTGAGKSTLVKLLFRFYDPDEGRIRIDGRDLRDVDVESLRESLGYVSQDTFLFSGTVRENLAYAAPAVDEEAMVRAAKLASAHEFVTDLPEGYDTEVGERGIKLSGGQRLRLTIAREILRDPSILVLDEATSPVDNATAVLIQRSMDELGTDRTMFVIAHRLSSVRDADRILVLDDGRVVQSGSHEELLAEDGLYANLWRIQVGEVETLSEPFLDRIRRRGVTE
jgi:ATP-binding cassette subfamily B protein